MKRVFVFFAVMAMAIGSLNVFAESGNSGGSSNGPTHIDWIKKGGSPTHIKRSIVRLAVEAVYFNGEILFSFSEDLGAATVDIYCPDGNVVSDMVDTAEGTATVTLCDAAAGEYTVVLATEDSVYEGYFAL